MASSVILLLILILLLRKALMRLIYKVVLFILHFFGEKVFCTSVDTKCTSISNHKFKTIVGRTIKFCGQKMNVTRFRTILGLQ